MKGIRIITPNEANDYDAGYEAGLDDGKQTILNARITHCCFCGKHNDYVTVIYTGKGVGICNDCLESIYDLHCELGN